MHNEDALVQPLEIRPLDHAMNRKNGLVDGRPPERMQSIPIIRNASLQSVNTFRPCNKRQVERLAVVLVDLVLNRLICRRTGGSSISHFSNIPQPKLAGRY